MTKIRDFPMVRGEVAPAGKAGTVRIGEDRIVNRLGYGAMRLPGPGVWGWPADREVATRVLRRAVELGVNFIDTSDAYGPEVNELQIAQALYPYPGDLVIATKGGLVRSGPGQWRPDCRPERLRECCENSLRRLRVDCVELYQLHAVDPNVPLEDQVGTLRDLRDEGKIRHVGVSNVTLDELREAEEIVPIVSVQNRYNMAYRDESESIIDYCERSGKVFLPWFPLGAGDSEIVSNAQIALAWLLHRSPIMLPIPGTSSIAHLEENVGAAAITLTDEDLVRLGLRPSTGSGVLRQAQDDT